MSVIFPKVDVTMQTFRKDRKAALAPSAYILRQCIHAGVETHSRKVPVTACKSGTAAGSSIDLVGRPKSKDRSWKSRKTDCTPHK